MVSQKPQKEVTEDKIWKEKIRDWDKHPGKQKEKQWPSK